MVFDHFTNKNFSHLFCRIGMRKKYEVCILNLSTTTIIELYPADLGSPSMKSMVKSSHLIWYRQWLQQPYWIERLCLISLTHFTAFNILLYIRFHPLPKNLSGHLLIGSQEPKVSSQD